MLITFCGSISNGRGETVGIFKKSFFLIMWCLTNKAHVPENCDGHVYIPLCCKPSFLSLLDQKPHLLEETIHHCLATTTEEQDILIFIANGAVMEEAYMAMDRPSVARRITSSVSAQMKMKVEEALAKINNPRIKGVVHWDDVASSARFRDVLTSLENIMHAKGEEDACSCQVHHHIKTLVKNLFTQRVAGSNITNVFTGEGLEIKKGGKYQKRYRHLERACLLELSIILVGLEYGNQVFTEMRYLTNTPQGMTFIAACLQDLRKALTTHGDLLRDTTKSRVLKRAASVSHGITFVKFTEPRNFIEAVNFTKIIVEAVAA